MRVRPHKASAAVERRFFPDPQTVARAELERALDRILRHVEHTRSAEYWRRDRDREYAARPAHWPPMPLYPDGVANAARRFVERGRESLRRGDLESCKALVRSLDQLTIDLLLKTETARASSSAARSRHTADSDRVRQLYIELRPTTTNNAKLARDIRRKVLAETRGRKVRGIAMPTLKRTIARLDRNSVSTK
jgi:hypothetical protein